MTGTELNAYLDTVIDKAYSDYWPVAKRNSIILEAMVKSEEVKYLNATAQKETDELFSLLRTNVPYTPVNNLLSLVTDVDDYLHLMAMQVIFSHPFNVLITSATNATPVVITLNGLTNLRDGDQVAIAGVGGNTVVNGTRYVKELYKDFYNRKFVYQLYTDAKLTVPLSGSGAYTSGGTISRFIYNWVKKKNAYRKYSTFGIPDESDPYYEIADGNLKILPLTETCTGVFMDYISKPAVLIDVTDNSVDLEITYPLRYLYFIMDETAKLMAMYSRDTEMYQTETIEVQQQP